MNARRRGGEQVIDEEDEENSDTYSLHYRLRSIDMNSKLSILIYLLRNVSVMHAPLNCLGRDIDGWGLAGKMKAKGD